MWRQKLKSLFIVDRPSKKDVQLAAATDKKPVTELQPLSGGKKLQVERVVMLRNSPDIGNYRSALKLAESNTRPDRRKLYEVYNEILLDAHLSSVMDRIIKRCTNNPIHFYKDGKMEESPVNDLTNTPFFYDLIRYIVESKWFGHSLIQCNFLEKTFDLRMQPGVDLVNRPNVRPEFGDILLKPGDEANAIPYRQTPWSNFLMEVGHANDLGLLCKIAPNVLYKRYGVADWSEFLEVYGMPIKEIAYDPNISGQRAEAEKILGDQGSNSGIAVPVGSTFKLHDSAKAGNSQAFEINASYHNGEISKLFLLQTMTTENGSSQSQAEVHMEAENEAIRSYRLFVEMMLNYKLKPILEAHGYPVADGMFKYDTREEISKVGMADLLVKLQSIADIPMSWVYETFNIPPPTGAEDVKDNPAARSQQPDLTKPAEKKNSALSLNVPEAYPAPHSVQLSFSDAPITATEEELLRQVWNEKLTTGKISSKHFNAVLQQLTGAISEGYGAPEGDFNSPDHLYKTMLEANVARFSGAKTAAMVQQMNEIKNSAKDFRDFQAQAGPLLGNYNVNWLRAEYDHAVATSQSAASWIREYASRDLYPYWEYSTAGDDRVRLAHEALDGRIFRYDDPEAAKLSPPNDWGCRCTRTQRSTPGNKKVSTLQDAIGGMGQTYWEKMKLKGFDYNAGSTLELFRKSQEYVKDFSPNGLNYGSFNREGFDKLPNKPGFKQGSLSVQAVLDWWNALIGKNDLSDAAKVRLLDYRKRPMDMSRSVALNSFTPSEVLPLIQDILDNPDEVWMTEGGTYRREYLKFFEGRAVVITVTFNREMGEQITNIAVLNSATAIDALRRGLLIKLN